MLTKLNYLDKSAGTRRNLHTHTHTHTHTSNLLKTFIQTIFVCSVIISVIFEAKADIELRWYDGNTLLGTDANTPNTCTYDGIFNVPTPTPRRGYVFTGWHITPQIDFSTIASYFSGDNSGLGYSRGVHSIYAGDTCMATTSINNRYYVDCSQSYYKDLQIYEWGEIKNSKKIYGSSKCSAKSGDTNSDAWDNDAINWRATYSELENASGDKNYCWCQLTGYDSGDNVIQRPLNSMPWVYVIAANNFSISGYNNPLCEQFCSSYCSAKFKSYSGLRDALFGPAGN